MHKYLLATPMALLLLTACGTDDDVSSEETITEDSIVTSTPEAVDEANRQIAAATNSEAAISIFNEAAIDETGRSQLRGQLKQRLDALFPAELETGQLETAEKIIRLYYAEGGDATVRAAATPALEAWAEEWVRNQTNYTIFQFEEKIPTGQLFALKDLLQDARAN